MNLSPYLKINRIEFIVTYHCTGRCLHCSVGDALGSCAGGHHVRTAEAVSAVRRLCELYDITSLMTFGGEPLIYPDVVCAIHSAARESGIPARQLITNGFFSRDVAAIDRVASELAASGVTRLMLSVDAFHQQTIPVAPVMRFARAVKETGIDISLHPAWLVNSAHDNKWNARTREILCQFADTGIRVSSGNDIFMAGNAAKNLSGYYPAPALDTSEKCGSMPYTSPLTAVDSISIEPNGDVVACAFVIGNIYKESIDDIVTRYDPFADETMRAVMDGAPAMLALAEKRGLHIDTAACRSVCDICRALNKK